MIKFQDVTATYKKNTGIFNISFDVEPGEMVFIMGPTGAGKSTVLKTIYKDVDIDSGKIFIDKKNIFATIPVRWFYYYFFIFFFKFVNFFYIFCEYCWRHKL